MSTSEPRKRTGMTPKYRDRIGGNIECKSIPQADQYPDYAPRPAYLSHVVLHSRRVPLVAAWWRTLLGMETTVSLENYALLGPDDGNYRFDAQFMTFDGEHHRIAIAAVTSTDGEQAEQDIPDDQRDGTAIPGAHSPLGHISFTYANLGDLVATFRRLQKAGIHPIRMLHHGATVSLYYPDPDGNMAELQVNAFKSMQDLNDWFVNGNFDPNPIGLTYDFDHLASLYEAGEDEDWLRRPDGYITQFADKQQ